MPPTSENSVEPAVQDESSTITATEREILLTEYKETIETLRNWDRLTIQILTVISTVSAALIAYSTQRNQPIPWTPITSLVTFWLAVYVWVVLLSGTRIDTIISLEQRLGMDGSYQRAQAFKRKRAAIFWSAAPLVCAFVIGPLLGYALSNPERIWAWLRQVWQRVFL